MKRFPFFKQADQMDCGPTCLRMISKHYGRNFRPQTLRQYCEINRDGVSLLGISNAAEKIGFRTRGVMANLDQLRTATMPLILHWRQGHFVVLRGIDKDSYHLADPAVGLVTLNAHEFADGWISDKESGEGIALALEPTPLFYETADESRPTADWLFLFRYLLSYRKMIMQLAFGLGIGSLLQVVAPFLTQSIVDIGINTRNLSFVYLVLFAQLVLIIGRVSVEFIRSWVLLYVSTRVNINILTDFLIKLMRLPISYFDTKMTGDIMQRMNDQKKIESFLTGSALGTAFSMFNLLVFSIVLAYYNLAVFLVFAASSALYVGWISLFLGRRRSLNYKSFEIASKNQSAIVQLVNGMQEIKLNNSEQRKRWEWEHIQARLFRYNMKTLALSQYQQGGATLINEGKNLLITFLSATAVINGSLTLGGMVAVQYMVGQLNSPIDQLLSFIQGFQDAKISLERLNEIHEMADEEPASKDVNGDLPENKSLAFRGVCFRYPGAGNERVLENVDIEIPAGKTTAIVGMSGSGKTTVLKLLLRFYEPETGTITVGEQALDRIAFRTWRKNCGVVMQDGFIFSDTIERNIAVGDEFPDKERVRYSIRVANLQDFLDRLPLGLSTKIGAEGNGISQGQRQRILIARAVYKDPSYLFFDEATNSLDANNETVIMRNLEEFLVGKTVVVVAHRLSTVRNADNIIVLEKGAIIEQGSHAYLTSLRGSYFSLVKNQLELGS